MAKKSSKIKASVLSNFLGDLHDALKKKGLKAAHDLMDKYEIGYTTKFTQNRYVVQQIIMSASIPYSKREMKKLPRETLNRLALIQEFLDNGVDASELDNYGCNMLMAASVSALPQCYQLLLEHGADPNVVNKLNDSPLGMNWRRLLEASHQYYPYLQSRLEILELLLRAGADPWREMPDWHSKNETQAFAIMTLMGAGCITVRQKINSILYDLFLNDPNISQRDSFSTSEPKEYKSEVSQSDAVKAVYTIRPLVQKGDLDGAIDLLRAQFGIDYTTTVINDGQYFMASLIGEMNELLTPDKKEKHDQYMALITRFLDNGVDVNRLDNHGHSPLLTISAFNREPELCKLLIKRGADPNIKLEWGYTPIDAAIKSYFFDKRYKTKMKECVSLLLKEKVDVGSPQRLVMSTKDGINWVYNTDPASQGLIKMFRKYGYLPKEEDEKAGK